jgi:drug/metabolite transporter (DMT)-like permease
LAAQARSVMSTRPSAASSDQRRRIDGRAAVLLVVCCVIWGLNQTVVKVTLAEVPPLTMAAVRSLGAAVLVALWARSRGIALFKRDGTAWAGVGAAALFAAEFGCIFAGLQLTSASRMTVFLYLAPFIVALGMPFVAAGERLSAVGWFGLVLAFVAVAAAFAEGWSTPVAGSRQWLGDALGIAAAVLWALTTLVVRGTALSRAAPEKTLLYQLAGSGIFLALAAALMGEPARWDVSPRTWLYMGYQIVLVGFASYLLWFWLVRHYLATQLSAWLLMTPLFGLSFGVWLLSEPLTGRLALALATVCIGIAIVSRAKAR